MQTPPLPSDESTRLGSLLALNILDTPPEERFDRITRLAMRLFQVPIALVSLIDAKRQWFKSRQGWDLDEVPRGVSFCGHAILGNDVFVVPDATLDVRFYDNPLVTGDPNLRFYAGVPLRGLSGGKLGTLCLIDTREREFSADDLVLLRDLARMVEQELAAVQLATMDELTLLSNRRGFEALVIPAMGLCRRLHAPAVMLYFDLDHFKHINESFGPAEGDRALCDFSALLRQNFRESDVVGRLGCDEFAVLATNMGSERLSIVLSRLRQGVDSHNRSAHRGYALQYSVGALEFDAQRHTSVDAMLKEADQMMVQHKLGRAAKRA